MNEFDRIPNSTDRNAFYPYYRRNFDWEELYKIENDYFCSLV